MKFLGHILCPTDGYTYIIDATKVTTYFSPDLSLYLTEVVCEQCGRTIEGKIDKEALIAFMGHGIRVIPYGNRFDPLTEDMILEWNIDKDLNLLDDECEDRQFEL